MHFIDTHIHLQDFNPDFALEVINNPCLKKMILISAKKEDFSKISSLATKYKDKIIPAYGIHPWYSDTQNSIDTLEKELSNNPLALVGEIGLDNLKQKVSPLQHDLFNKQLDLAKHYNRPIIIHGAKAFNELLTYETRLKQTKFVYHGFTKNFELLKFINRCNGYFGLGPMFLKQKNASTYFNLMPIDKILFETDAPYQLDEKTYNQTTKENLEKLSKISTISLPKLQNILLKNTMEFIKC